MPRIELMSDLVYTIPSPVTTGSGTMTDRYDIQPDIDNLFNNYDFRGHNVTIQLAAGSNDATRKWYKGFLLSGRFVGQSGLGIPLLNMPSAPPFEIGRKGRFSIIGNPAFPTGAFFWPAANERAAVSMSEGAALHLEAVGMDTARSNQDCIDVFHGAFLSIANIVFGNAGEPPDSFCNHVSLAFGATVFVSGKLVLSGSAASFANNGSASGLYWNNNGDPGYPLIVDLSSNPTFAKGFVLTDASVSYLMAIQWIGSFNGPKARVYRAGVVETNGAGIPGSQPEELFSGGQFL
jgi:hypothetical protein